MSNSIQRWFSNPETFRGLQSDLFWTWLKQSEGYLVRRGIVLPADHRALVRDAFNPGFDYDRLIQVFMEPTPDMPPELVEGLHLVYEMGRPANMNKMYDEAQKYGWDLGLGEMATPQDVALKLLLLDPRALADMRNCGVIR